MSVPLFVICSVRIRVFMNWRFCAIFYLLIEFCFDFAYIPLWHVVPGFLYLWALLFGRILYISTIAVLCPIRVCFVPLLRYFWVYYYVSLFFYLFYFAGLWQIEMDFLSLLYVDTSVLLDVFNLGFRLYSLVRDIYVSGVC